MEMNEKLKHLSKEQIVEILEMYQDKSIKVSEIIKKYNINVTPSGFLKILPPIVTEEVCDICGEYMFKSLQPRTSYPFRKASGNPQLFNIRDESVKTCISAQGLKWLFPAWKQKTNIYSTKMLLYFF